MPEFLDYRVQVVTTVVVTAVTAKEEVVGEFTVRATVRGNGIGENRVAALTTTALDQIRKRGAVMAAAVDGTEGNRRK